jgi:hypothetical protein
MMGFFNFLLATCLFPVVLGIWWSGFERMDRRRAVLLIAILILAYFFHVLTFLVMVFALLTLCLCTPGRDRLMRWRWMGVVLAPLVPIVLWHGMVVETAGGFVPGWLGRVKDWWSLSAWYSWLESADAFSLTRNMRRFPFVAWDSPWFRLIHAPNLFALGLLVAVTGVCLDFRRIGLPAVRRYRGWIILVLLLGTGWIVLPDFFVRQGGWIRYRFLLFALLVAVPFLGVNPDRRYTKLAAILIVGAVLVQSALVWEVALGSSKFCQEFLDARSHVGTGRRIGTLVIDPPHQSKPPILGWFHHILGIDTQNIVWHNYEPIRHVFPLKYRHEAYSALSEAFAKLDRRSFNSASRQDLIDQWARLVSQYHDKIDVLVVWGRDPELDRINSAWYGPEPVFEKGAIRVFLNRDHLQLSHLPTKAK